MAGDARKPETGKAEAGELLIELRAEEMPPRLVPQVARRLGTRLFEELMGAGLAPTEVTSGQSRRRIVFWCRGLPASARPREVREIGPPAAEAWDDGGEPTEALVAFAARIDAPLEDIVELRTERGAYAGVVREVAGRTAPEILMAKLPGLLAESTDEQAMVWGARRGPWLRPLSSLIVLFEGQVVPLSVFGVDAGDHSSGHPVLSPERFSVASAAEYFERLTERGIVVRLEERRGRLAAALEQSAKEHGGVIEDSAAVVARMALDCEIPGLVEGRIAPEHMALPEAILCAALAERPGAVVLRDATGALLPRFITVMDRLDDPDGVVAAGYERAVAGRLADVVFLRDLDRRSSLARHAERLADLRSPFGGTWADHGERVGALAGRALDLVGETALHPAAELAASLIHADRVTALVTELGLPAGLVGGTYAREEGLDDAVWQAIADHRMPRGTDGPLPRGRVGRAVALADRLLRICGALRAREADAPPSRSTLRAADAAVRLLIEGKVDLDLDLLVGRAVRLGEAAASPVDPSALTVRVADLLRARAERLLARRGFAFDEIAAAALTGGRLVDLLSRAEALRGRRDAPELGVLVRAARRIERMVVGADIELVQGSEDSDDEAEARLETAIESVRTTVGDALADERFDVALEALEPLGPAVDRFFEEVLVMAEDPRRRARRLALLATVRRLLLRVARLTELRLVDARGESR